MNPFTEVVPNDVAVKIWTCLSKKYENKVDIVNNCLLTNNIVRILTYLDIKGPSYDPDIHKSILDPESCDETINKLVNNHFIHKTWKNDKEIEENQKKVVTIMEPNTNDTCKYCHKKKIHVSEIQSRSADEPMTKIYECLACKKIWKRCN